jgi:hypothetical protein
VSEKLTGISSNGQELIKRHNFDPNLIDYIREKEQRITEFLNHAEALEAEVKALREQLEVTARLGGEQARGAIYLNHQLIKAESRLTEAEKLADKLCNSQPDPYDDAYSDSAPWLTMRRQIGRELKKALHGVNVCETCVHFEKMEKLEYAWCPHKGDFLYENHLVCGDYIKRGVGEDSAILALKEGRVKTFKNTDDLFKDLDGRESEEEGKS